MSHAIRKGPALHSGREAVDDLSAGMLQAVAPASLDPQLTAFALRVVEAGPSLLYARVDTAAGADGEPLLLELEATEPFLFLEHAPAGAARFATAVAAWLDGGVAGP